jgi:adenylate cyclase
MFDAIGSHGGVVTQMMGDGLMSVFGAPMPLADHCDSAVSAAQEMVELMDLFNVERDATGKPRITIGIGIASGEVVAGYAGTNQRATYTCIGDVVNLAARLETHTKVTQRSILIDDVTRSALGDRVAAEPLGPVPFKGKATAVEVFSVDPGQHR